MRVCIPLIKKNDNLEKKPIHQKHLNNLYNFSQTTIIWRKIYEINKYFLMSFYHRKTTLFLKINIQK